MGTLDVLAYPDERLKQAAATVTDFGAALQAVVRDLHDTLYGASHCVGLAATQAGIPLRVALVDVSRRPGVENHGRLVLINPEILSWDGFEIGREGCFSVPDYTGNVVRAQRLTARFQDEQGRERDLEFTGFEARAVQHEIDHLNGLLFLDRLVSHRNDLFRRKVYKK